MDSLAGDLGALVVEDSHSVTENPLPLSPFSLCVCVFVCLHLSLLCLSLYAQWKRAVAPFADGSFLFFTPPPSLLLLLFFCLLSAECVCARVCLCTIFFA